MDISHNLNDTINDLFTHSAQWNQLKTLTTSDGNILNLDPEFLTSLEELCVSQQLYQKPLLHVTRCWSGLKAIELYSNNGIYIIAYSVERGMFPDLKIVSVFYKPANRVSALPLFKLFKANIVVMMTTF